MDLVGKSDRNMFLGRMEVISKVSVNQQLVPSHHLRCLEGWDKSHFAFCQQMVDSPPHTPPLLYIALNLLGKTKASGLSHIMF